METCPLYSHHLDLHTVIFNLRQLTRFGKTRDFLLVLGGQLECCFKGTVPPNIIVRFAGYVLSLAWLYQLLLNREDVLKRKQTVWRSALSSGYLLCSTEERNSCMFGLSLGRGNEDRNVIFEWTNPVSHWNTLMTEPSTVTGSFQRFCCVDVDDDDGFCRVLWVWWRSLL